MLLVLAPSARRPRQAQVRGAIQGRTAPPAGPAYVPRLAQARVCGPDGETTPPRMLTPGQEACGLHTERVSSLQGLRERRPAASASGDVLLQRLTQEACVVRTPPVWTSPDMALCPPGLCTPPSPAKPDTTGPLSSLGIECGGSLRVPRHTRMSAEAEAHGAPGDDAPRQMPRPRPSRCHLTPGAFAQQPGPAARGLAERAGRAGQRRFPDGSLPRWLRGGRVGHPSPGRAAPPAAAHTGCVRTATLSSKRPSRRQRRQSKSPLICPSH